MANPTAIATSSVVATTPATLAAAWAAFGVVAPEVVLPVTAAVAAFTMISTYFAANTLNYITHHSDEVNAEMIGDAHHPIM